MTFPTLTFPSFPLPIWLDGVIGNGLIPFDYTVTSTADSSPISGVVVEVYTDTTLQNPIRRGTTNSFGVIRFWMTTAGTYYLVRAKDGFEFDAYDTEVVS